MRPELPFDEAVTALIASALTADAGLLVVTEDARAPWPADRRVVVPVADRGGLGLALGLALGGRRVIVECTGTARLPALAEGLAEAGAVAVAGEFPVPLIVRVPWGNEAAGLDQPVGRWLLDVPGLTVVAPSSGAGAAALWKAALGRPAPTVILEPRALGRDRRAGHGGAGPSVVRAGRDLVLAAYGAHVGAALAAAEALAAEGIEATVMDLVTVAPFDAEALGAAVRATGRLVFVGEDAALARRVREAALDAAFLHLESPLAASGPSTEHICRIAREAVTY